MGGSDYLRIQLWAFEHGCIDTGYESLGIVERAWSKDEGYLEWERGNVKDRDQMSVAAWNKVWWVCASVSRGTTRFSGRRFSFA